MNVASNKPRAVALVGSYRQGGAVDQATAALLAELETLGVETRTIFLRQHRIDYCSNCRQCLQVPGTARGKCYIDDDVEGILKQLEAADLLILGAPTNAGNANALTRAFLERCVGFAYWPWDQPAPKIRNPHRDKRALLVSASGAPAPIGKYLSGTRKALKQLAEMLGARPVGTGSVVGGVIRQEFRISEQTRAACRKRARKLVAGA